jgi:hydrogenase expression/formation protein HypC
MCLGIPARVIEFNESENWALVDSNGVVFRISTGILGEKIEIGDFLMVHAGFAIGKIEKEDAEERMRIIREIISDGS